jgi:3D (Asp-Asp-Asp) domain-containing protein
MTTTITLIKRLSLTVLLLVLGVTSIPSASAQTVTVPDTTFASAVSDNPVQIDNVAPLRPVLTYKVDMTAYNSEVGQTDADPFTAADGTTTYDGMIAVNFLPFGTKVRIPELFGDKVFTVHDRMNRRYWYRVDVWMKDKSAAKKFGLHKNVKIEIVELGDGKTLYTKRAEAKRLATELKKLEAAKLKEELAAAKK